MSLAPRRCAGHRVSGYWEGYPCGAVPTVFKNGVWWCRSHVPLEDVTIMPDDTDYTYEMELAWPIPNAAISGFWLHGKLYQLEEVAIEHPNLQPKSSRRISQRALKHGRPESEE